MTPAIDVRNLTVRYGDRLAVDGLGFRCEAGTVTALLGPNGAGKTSTVETLEGFRRPDGGTVRVLGLDPHTEHSRLMPSVGVMLQEGGVYPGIRPMEVLRLFASYYDNPRDPTALLDRVGLSDRVDRTWRQLSGGEQQRLSLALALVGRPAVAFLDEPTAGVDPAGRRLIRSIVADLRDEGVCVLLTTHDIDEAEHCSDQVVIIDHGRLVASGAPGDLGRQGPEDLRFRATSGLDLTDLGSALGTAAAPVRVEEPAPGEFVVHASPTPDLVARLTSWLAARDLPLDDLRAGRRSLEDVYLRLTGEEGDR